VLNCDAKLEWCFKSRTRFQKSIFDNVAYGLKINRLTDSKAELEERVKQALQDVAMVGSRPMPVQSIISLLGEWPARALSKVVVAVHQKTEREDLDVLHL